MRAPFFALLASLFCLSSNAIAQDASASDTASPYANIFGLHVGQSPESVEDYLQNTFGIAVENYKSYMMPDAPLDGAQMVIEVPATTISVPFDSEGEPTDVEIDSLEIYFTYKIPLAETPELGAYYFAIRYIDDPSIEKQMLAYAMDTYGEPVIDNNDGPQWCHFVSDDGDACASSCESWDTVDPCAPNPAVGLGEYFSGVLAFGLADWSAAPNYKAVVKSR